MMPRRMWDMIDILVFVAVAVIVVILVWWLLQQVPLPQPARKIVRARPVKAAKDAV